MKTDTSHLAQQVVKLLILFSFPTLLNVNGRIERLGLLRTEVLCPLVRFV